MHSLETLSRLNRNAVEGKPPQNPLRHHPRIFKLRMMVNQLPVDGLYRAALHRSLDRYADQFIAMPETPPEGGLSDFEDLQQVTLSDINAAYWRTHWLNSK